MTTITIKPYNKCETENFLEMTDKEFDEWRDKVGNKGFNIHHEVISGRVRPYFDFELDFKTEEDMKKNQYSSLKEAEMEIAKAYRRKGEVIFLDSSGFTEEKELWRVSGRFFVQGAGYYSDPKHLKNLVKTFTTKGFDQGVYYNNKTMRNAYCHKEGDNRTLRRAAFDNKKVQVMAEDRACESQGETWRDWMVGDYWKKEKKCLSPADDESDSESEDEEEDKGYTRAAMPLTMIKGYLNALSEERATSRNYRRMVIMACRHLADHQNIDLRELAHDFATGAGNNYDEVKVDEAYDNPDRKAKFNFNQVISWARKDTPDIEETLNPKVDDTIVPSYYNDVRDLLMDPNTDIDDVKKYMRGCIAKVSNNGNPVFFQRGEDEWTLLDDKGMPYSNVAENYRMAIPNPNYNPKSKAVTNVKFIDIRYKEIFQQVQQSIPFLTHCSFDRANFKPFHGISPYPKRMFNLFTGFRFKVRKDFKPTGKCDLLIAHIREVLANGHTESFEYLMSWMAHMFQFPGDKPGKCPVFRSLTRAGKNTVFDFIRRKMMPEYSSELKDMDSLLQKHNTHRMNQILTVLNEVGNFGGDKRNNNKLKSIITDEQILIEPKGAKPFFIDDVCRYAMLTNNKWPVDVNDERYPLFQCSNHRRGDIPYFKALRATLDDACAEEFFQILMARDLTNFEVREAPHTDMADELLQYAESTTMKFLVEIGDRGTDMRGMDMVINNEIKFHRDVLYDEYVAWAKRGNAYVQNRDDFLAELAKIGLSTTKNFRLNTVQGRGVNCTLQEFRTLITAIPAFKKHSWYEPPPADEKEKGMDLD